MRGNIRSVVQLVADTLSEEHNWIASKPTPKQAFAVELLALFCSRVTINSLELVCKFSSSLHSLGEVYRTCNKEYRIAVMDGSIPDQINENPCHFVKEYFTWVLGLCCLLKHWSSAHADSYEHLLRYNEHHSSIDTLAKAIAAEGLVVSQTLISEENKSYLVAFETLNTALICYTNDNQDFSW